MFNRYGLGATIIFAATLLLSFLALSRPRLMERLLLRPWLLARRKQYERLVTSGFVHADLGHLIFNMVTFYFFAFQLERYIGTARFVALYFLGLVLSNVGTVFKHRNDPEYASLGASGAILAVLFASIVYDPGQSLLLFPIPVPIPAPLFAVGYLAYSIWAARRQQGRINHDAHIGGAITGVLFVAVVDPQAIRALLERFT